MRISVCLAAVLILTSSSFGQSRPGRVVSWPTFVSNFLDGYFAHRPDLAVLAGRHDFDGRLPNWSREGMALMVHFLKEQRTAAEKFGSLNRAEEFERQYLIAQINSDLFHIEVLETPYTNPTFYTSFQGLDPNVYVTREYAPLEKRMAAFTAYARNVPTAVEQIRANLRTPMPRTFINVGRTGFGGLASFFEKDVPAVFASVQNTNLQSEFAEANTNAITALTMRRHSRSSRSSCFFPARVKR